MWETRRIDFLLFVLLNSPIYAVIAGPNIAPSRVDLFRVFSFHRHFYTRHIYNFIRILVLPGNIRNIFLSRKTFCNYIPSNAYRPLFWYWKGQDFCPWVQE